MVLFGTATCPLCGAVGVRVNEEGGSLLRYGEHRRAARPGRKAPIVEPGGAADWCNASNRWVGAPMEKLLRKAGPVNG